MDQKEIMRLLENMMKSSDEMLDMAKKECEEANKPESDHYNIRDLFYENVQYFKGYRQAISNVLCNIRKYYYEEEVRQVMQSIASAQNLKLKSAALYGESVKEAEDESEVQP